MNVLNEFSVINLVQKMMEALKPVKKNCGPRKRMVPMPALGKPNSVYTLCRPGASSILDLELSQITSVQSQG